MEWHGSFKFAKDILVVFSYLVKSKVALFSSNYQVHTVQLSHPRPSCSMAGDLDEFIKQKCLQLF